MPGRRSHLAKADANECLVNALDLNESTQVEWAITFLFYSAVHLVEAYLAGKGRHSRDHTEREDEIARNAILQPIQTPYRRLRNLSRLARYDATQLHRVDLDRRALPEFRQIKAHIHAVLGIRS